MKKFRCCLCKKTFEGWGHKTTVIRNGYDYPSHKVRYYNRTWECYTYETCMRGAVSEIYGDECERFINIYKEENGISRFKNGEKLKVIKMFSDTELGQDLKELKEAIRDRNFD